MTVSSSIEGTARRLTELLPTVDLPESSLQWQAQLLSNYSGHVFVPHGVEMSTPTLWQAVLESSLAQLSMQAEIADLRSQNQFLKNEQQRLEGEIKDVEVRSRRQERMIQQLESSTNSHKYVRPSTPPRHSSSSTHHSFRPPSPKASTSTSRSFFSIPPSSGSRSDLAHGHIGKRPTPPSDLDNGTILYAMRLQHEFDAEDSALSAQRIELARSAQRLFKCDICMEEIPEDSIARPDSCGHTFCRECLRGHVTARLDEHRFPILCPTCTANKGKGKGSVGGACRMCSLNVTSLHDSPRGFAVSCHRPRTYR
jgi:Ring finger domain